MSRLATLIDRTKPTVTCLVNKLEKNGYVNRIADPEDNRVVRVQLTEKAISLNDDFGKVSKIMRERIFKGFSQAERHILTEYLGRAISNFKEK